MKKQLLTLAAALAVGAGVYTMASVDLTETTVCADATYGEKSTLFNMTTEYSGSETMYDKALFSALPEDKPVYVYELFYPYGSGAQDLTGQSVDLKVYAYTKGDNTILPIQSDTFGELVYDGTYEFTADVAGVKLTLDKPFEFTKGENLIIGVLAHNTGSTAQALTLQDPSLGTMGKNYAFTGNSFANASTGRTWGPGLVISWSEEAPVVEEPTQPEEPTKEVLTGNVLISSDQYGWSGMGNMNTKYCAVQIPYTAAQLAAATNNLDTYTIETIEFPFTKEQALPSEGIVNYKAYLYKTTEAWSGQVPAADFTLVADVNINFATCGYSYLTIPLDDYFVMNAGENIVVGLVSEQLEKPSGNVNVSSNTNGDMVGASGNDPLTLGSELSASYNGGYTVDFAIQYEAGEVTKEQPTEPDVINVSISDLKAPVLSEGEQMVTNVEYTYTAKVANNGNVDVESYTVKLYSFKGNQWSWEGETVVDKTLYAGSTTTVEIPVAFNQGLTSQVKAVLVLDDNTATETETEPIALEVIELPYAAPVLSAVGENFTSGEELTVKVTVNNPSTKKATDLFVELYVSRPGYTATLVEKKTGINIDDYESAECEFTYTPELGGEYEFTAVVGAEGMQSVNSEKALTIDVAVADRIALSTQETVPSLDGASAKGNYPLFNRQSNRASAELVYSADYFGNHNNAYQIQQISFFFQSDDQQYKCKPAPVQIYMAQTNLEYFASKTELVPEEDFELVYEGLMPQMSAESGIQPILFNLQRNFTLENGKGLAIVINMQDESSAPLPAIVCQDAGNYVMAYSKNGSIFTSSYISMGSGYGSWCDWLPCLDITYALEPLPAVVDLKAASLEAPADDINVNEAATFRVGLYNEGTADIDGCTIELLDVTDEANPVVLDTYESSRYIAVGESTTLAVKYTFTTEGEYKIAARVIAEDDSNAANNLTEIVTVKVTDPTGVGNILAEGTLSYNAAARTLNVNLGACVVSVNDLAGRTVATWTVDGAARLQLDLNAGVYVVNAAGKSLKIKL